MKAIIIEDETKTRESLEYLLAKYCPQVKTVAAVSNFAEGFDLLKKEKPRLAFVDIQLNSPEGTGLDLISVIDTKDCAFILISGYKDYAVDAFRLKAVDYLLKPISIQHLKESVEKAERFLGETSVPHKVAETKNDVFHIPTSGGVVILRQPTIIRCQADGSYTHFFVSGKKDKITSSLNIGQIEEKLSNDFMRVHKSHIINKHFIESYSRSEGLIVRMSDHSEIPVSRNQKDTFFEWMS